MISTLSTDQADQDVLVTLADTSPRRSWYAEPNHVIRLTFLSWKVL
jgi:hypothetical protein